LYRHADIKKKNTLLRQFGRYSVSLYPYQIKKLEELRALALIDNEILTLDARYYDDKLGVVFDTNLELLGVWR
jgi:hypothetical protein